MRGKRRNTSNGVLEARPRPTLALDPPRPIVRLILVGPDGIDDPTKYVGGSPVLASMTDTSVSSSSIDYLTDSNSFV